MYKFILLVLLAGCFPVAMCGEDTVSVSLQNVAVLVREQNPNLVSAKYLIEEARGRHEQAGRLENPSLQVSYSQNAGIEERELTIGFSQKFPLTSRLRLEKTITESEWRQVTEEVRHVERELIMSAQSTIIRIIALRERRQLLEKQSAILLAFAESLREAAEKGEGSQLEAQQARLESDIFKLEIQQLSAAEIAEIGALKPLLGLITEQDVVIEGSLGQPQEHEHKSVDLTQRADYLAANYRVGAAADGLDLARAHQYEDIEVGVFAGWGREKELPAQYEDKTIMGVQLTVPLPLWNRNRGAIMEAQSRLRRREHELSALGRNIQQQAATARAEMSQWSALYQEIEEKLSPLAEEHATLAEKAYLQGMSEIAGVLRAKERQVQLQLAKLDALREYHLARIRYETAVSNQ
jgi:cobalt-zinc-cadmium efflux system outer membrane protein